MEVLSLLFIDDYPDLMLLAQEYLEQRGKYQVVTATSYEEAFSLLKSYFPSCLVCDINSPITPSYRFLKTLREHPKYRLIPFLLMSDSGDFPELIRGLSLGADGYLKKPFLPQVLLQEVQAAVRQATALPTSVLLEVLGKDSARLTATEKKVVYWIIRGLSNREIAQELYISKRTVDTHVRNILGKTGLQNRTELAHWAYEQGNHYSI
ncbi:response regulator transcription factor [Desertifilum sp. FACHB-1129]|uniref:Response regulator transcription factor n=1 Tax=Desertifilum tharense IPPAS B-1220 TaxID=1781255 RepID=A0ACD5GPZ5_9CYAN|nr:MULTISPECIES: response regulator transcription factor [Desertifilum]MCD8487998.1 response regulator transcription factor [Desertifilum sp.]MDA0211846.1 response regulator transcription factor [Cyanobacteria bacterium FC1]MBD2314885.1 response regulator transcription factor [Desertifilum sp. FACHB-1129]MBD2320414.1 response regulator transcription factor [Desertifilum sp. FACHB-866]MBD2330542.1 response regulator transcription factor [Desertifilum sp. FACHB-868]